MARRNRKKKKVDAYIFPRSFAGLILLASVLALLYVWLGCRCEGLGKDLRTLEVRNEQLENQQRTEVLRWSRMKSPRNIEHRLAMSGIRMTYPRRDQVVRIYSDSRYREHLASLDRIVMNE